MRDLQSLARGNNIADKAEMEDDMKNNLKILLSVAIKYGVSSREVNAIKQSNREVAKKPFTKQSAEMCQAVWALSKCQQSIRNRQAVDVKMLTKALPAITSFQVLRRMHDQLEDLTIPYEQLEPIYAALVELSKNFMASLMYFELIRFDCPYYDDIIESQYRLARNVYAIDKIGHIGLRYLAYIRDTLELSAVDLFELTPELMDDPTIIKWSERLVDDILEHAKSAKEAKLALYYVRNDDDYYRKMYYSATKVIDKMLRLANSKREVEQILEYCDETVYDKKEALANAMKQV